MGIFRTKSRTLTFGEDVSIREYLESVIVERYRLLERLVDERDRQYDARFRAAEIAVTAALQAQEKSVTSAFAASEKAIIKAEDAQREYNARSNEFRAQLDDQAKTLMPRTETTTIVKALEDRIVAATNTFDAKLESRNASVEKSFDSITKEIAGLRESRSALTGKSAGANAIYGYVVGAAGIVIAIISIVTVILHG